MEFTAEATASLVAQQFLFTGRSTNRVIPLLCSLCEDLLFAEETVCSTGLFLSDYFNSYRRKPRSASLQRSSAGLMHGILCVLCVRYLALRSGRYVYSCRICTAIVRDAPHKQ